MSFNKFEKEVREFADLVAAEYSEGDPKVNIFGRPDDYFATVTVSIQGRNFSVRIEEMEYAEEGKLGIRVHDDPPNYLDLDAGGFYTALFFHLLEWDQARAETLEEIRGIVNRPRSETCKPGFETHFWLAAKLDEIHGLFAFPEFVERVDRDLEGTPEAKVGDDPRKETSS